MTIYVYVSYSCRVNIWIISIFLNLNPTQLIKGDIYPLKHNSQDPTPQTSRPVADPETLRGGGVEFANKFFFFFCKYNNI